MVSHAIQYSFKSEPLDDENDQQDEHEMSAEHSIDILIQKNDDKDEIVEEPAENINVEKVDDSMSFKDESFEEEEIMQVSKINPYVREYNENP